MSFGLPSLEKLSISTSSGVGGGDSFNFGSPGPNPWVGTVTRSDTLTGGAEGAAAVNTVVARYAPWAAVAVLAVMLWRKGGR